MIDKGARVVSVARVGGGGPRGALAQHEGPPEREGKRRPLALTLTGRCLVLAVASAALGSAAIAHSSSGAWTLLSSAGHWQQQGVSGSPAPPGRASASDPLASAWVVRLASDPAPPLPRCRELTGTLELNVTANRSAADPLPRVQPADLAVAEPTYRLWARAQPAPGAASRERFPEAVHSRSVATMCGGYARRDNAVLPSFLPRFACGTNFSTPPLGHLDVFPVDRRLDAVSVDCALVYPSVSGYIAHTVATATGHVSFIDRLPAPLPPDAVVDVDEVATTGAAWHADHPGAWVPRARAASTPGPRAA